MPSTLSETLPTNSSAVAMWSIHSNRTPVVHTRSAPVMQSNANELPIRLLLIDKDPISRSLIRRALFTQADFRLISEVDYNPISLEKASALRPDAILMDVETLGSSGFDAELLLSKSFRPIVVFLTTQRDFAIEAFELGATDYLLKPFSKDRFDKTLNRIRQHHQRRSRPMSEPHKRITITDRRKTHLIEPDQIEWISAAGDYTELHINGATHLLREPFSALLGRLPANVFCRIHRSFAVNLSRITGFKALRNQDLLVRLKDKTILRASRTFSDDFKRALSQQCI